MYIYRLAFSGYTILKREKMLCIFGTVTRMRLKAFIMIYTIWYGERIKASINTGCFIHRVITGYGND